MEVEKELRARQLIAENQFPLRIQFGNRHEIVKNNKKGSAVQNNHRWTAFIKFTDPKVNQFSLRLIEKVRFGLHPSFGVDHMDVKANAEGKFEIAFNGFGTFTVPITIFFRREVGLPYPRQVKLDHYLSFEGKGGWKTVQIDIEK